MAFCLTGASRSLPTVPVLRGFKKNVLQSRRYVAAAFAALSLSPNVPGVHDSNLTLANKLSNVLYVRRAMQRLQPELKSWVSSPMANPDPDPHPHPHPHHHPPPSPSP